ncbi:MAG: hypothetical protein H6567_02525 [Lewinellaceae bacterium]|nr:hypothetical protein [Lewinellaceae bacterium]
MKSYWKNYGVLCVLILPVLFFILNQSSQLQNIEFIVLVFVLYTLMSSIIFILLKRSLKSVKKQSFLHYSIGYSFVKILVSIAVVLAYKFFADAYNKNIILPFIIVYIGFTIFETIFMTRLATYNPR